MRQDSDETNKVHMTSQYYTGTSSSNFMFPVHSSNADITMVSDAPVAFGVVYDAVDFLWLLVACHVAGSYELASHHVLCMCMPTNLVLHP